MRPIAIMLLLASLVSAEPMAIYGGRIYTPSNYSHAYTCRSGMCANIRAQWAQQQSVSYVQPVTAVRHAPTVGAVVATPVVSKPQCEGYTPHDVVDAIFRIVKPKKGDRFIDAGSGDGRVVIAAAKAGFDAKGIELDNNRVASSRRRIEDAGAELYHGNADGDWYRYADVVFIYQHTDLQSRIVKRLQPGTVLITYGHDPGMGAEKYERESDGATFYVATVPNRNEFRKVAK